MARAGNEKADRAKALAFLAKIHRLYSISNESGLSAKTRKSAAAAQRHEREFRFPRGMAPSERSRRHRQNRADRSRGRHDALGSRSGLSDDVRPWGGLPLVHREGRAVPPGAPAIHLSSLAEVRAGRKQKPETSRYNVTDENKAD
ncbi:hypothetical protein HPB49_006362 [Dermacentor silvarum]|uniref:Uncharacterized protein n=1 Tax=Dermacentor silvarum TaxID=543639 RepID=A0ACB8DVZ9_DERSI|nr:hypothetical protein HPB49_006362 [Dermacentor silvarum]